MTYKFFFFPFSLFFFLSSFLFGQKLEVVESKKRENIEKDLLSQRESPCKKTQVIRINGIVFGLSEEFFQLHPFPEAKGVMLNKIKIPGDVELFSNKMQKFIDKPLTETKVREIRETIAKHFFEYNHPAPEIKILDDYFQDGIVKVVLRDLVIPCEPKCKD
jgi:hypothetical protein